MKDSDNILRVSKLWKNLLIFALLTFTRTGKHVWELKRHIDFCFSKNWNSIYFLFWSGMYIFVAFFLCSFCCFFVSRECLGVSTRRFFSGSQLQVWECFQVFTDTAFVLYCFAPGCFCSKQYSIYYRFQKKLHTFVFIKRKEVSL